MNQPAIVNAVLVDPVQAHVADAPPQWQVNEAGARSFLSQFRWPTGLQDAFIKNLQRVPFRFFICDDSGSMMANDGHRLVGNSGHEKMISCSRWAELTESLRFHANLSAAAGAPSEFRLLNGSPPITVGTNDYNEGDNFARLMTVLDNPANGGTPLCRHINEVIQTIIPMEPFLRANGQKVAVVIATDGESSDGEIAIAMRPLKGLPVWVVIRLCTDDDKIVEYWNNVDQELELNMDVLDDLCGEAKEVYVHNNWLTYGEPLQKIREFGITIKELDLLDESKLSLEQVRQICSIIYGIPLNQLPHPEADWGGFIIRLKQANKSMIPTWNPMSRTTTEWINQKKLASSYNKGSCAIT
eukprot:gene15297-20605_t